MRSCATSTVLLSLFILALFLLDGLQCARTSSRDRVPASAPARSSASSRSSSSSSSNADSDLLTDECPEPNGYFADGYQCDKYYECIEGVINEKLCPDGMVFNDYSIQYEKCDLPFNIDCSSRPQLQEPRPSLNCPRQNGYFAHENATVCDKFYYCVDGKYNMITCPSGLVYNEKTGICTWPDEAKKKHCSSEEGEELNGREKKERQKRVSTWPAGDEEEVDDHQEVSASYEDHDGRPYEEIDDGESRESFGEDYVNYDDSLDFTSNEGQFPYDPEFENFDAEFANFGLSDESVSSESDHYDSIQKRRRIDDDDDVDELDDYIREYVKQANKGGGDKAAGMDLSYYEKIAEEAVKKEAEKKMAEESATNDRGEKKEAANKGTNHTSFNRTAFGLRDLLLPYRCIGFECPKVDVTVGQQHPRYADPEDCQFFYVCINGEVPRRNGCKRGQVFNEVTGACDWPRNVPECRDWYKGILTDEELEALEHPKPKVRNSTAAAKRKGQPRPYYDIE